MLNKDFIVRKGIEGIDPDTPDTVKDPLREYQRRERAWLMRHPAISEKRKNEMRALGLKSIKFIQKPLSHPSISEMIDTRGLRACQNTLASQKLGIRKL